MVFIDARQDHAIRQVDSQPCITWVICGLHRHKSGSIRLGSRCLISFIGCTQYLCAPVGKTGGRFNLFFLQKALWDKPESRQALIMGFQCSCLLWEEDFDLTGSVLGFSFWRGSSRFPFDSEWLGIVLAVGLSFNHGDLLALTD